MLHERLYGFFPEGWLEAVQEVLELEQNSLWKLSQE